MQQKTDKNGAFEASQAAFLCVSVLVGRPGGVLASTFLGSRERSCPASRACRKFGIFMKQARGEPRAFLGEGAEADFWRADKQEPRGCGPRFFSTSGSRFDPCRPATAATFAGHDVRSLRRLAPPARAPGSPPTGKTGYRPGVLSCLRQLLVLLDQKVATTLTSPPSLGLENLDGDLA